MGKKKINNANILIFIVFILLSCVYSCNHKDKDKKHSEKIVLEWHDSLKAKPKKVFSKNNNNNLRNGIYKIYRVDGTLMSETQLKNGKRNGISKNYYSNGELFYIAEFKNNILDGNVLTYSKDGNILSKGLYCKGEKCGDWYYYDKKGNIKKIQNFD